MYVTEDTTRCDPEMVKRLYSTAISCGARAICDLRHGRTRHADGRVGAGAVCDRRSREALRRKDSRGLARSQRSRPRRLRIPWLRWSRGPTACTHRALGLGERVGNTQMDQMLVNLKLMGVAPWDKQDLTRLKDYCMAVSRATGIPIPANYPVVGEDAFRTATGVHAAAIIKAYQEERCRAGERGVFRRALACVRAGADHRHRPDERQIERACSGWSAAAFRRPTKSSIASTRAPSVRPHSERRGDSGVRHRPTSRRIGFSEVRRLFGSSEASSL